MKAPFILSAVAGVLLLVALVAVVFNGTTRFAESGADAPSINLDASANTVNYGQGYLLQNQYGNADTWLTGGRGKGNEGVRVYDFDQSDRELSYVKTAYTWIVRSNGGGCCACPNCPLSRYAPDPKSGQCIKYDNEIRLQVNNMNDRYLTGNRGKGNHGVRTDTPEQATGWKVKSSVGLGTRHDKDPLSGQCVPLNGVVFLLSIDYRFLDNGVHTDSANPFKRDAKELAKFEWRFKSPSNPNSPNSLSLPASSANFEWAVVVANTGVSNSMGDRSIGITATMGGSNTKTETDSLSVADSVKVSAETGGGFLGLADTKFSTEASTTTTRQFSSSVAQSQSFSESRSTSCTKHFGCDPNDGYPVSVWQWKVVPTESDWTSVGASIVGGYRCTYASKTPPAS